jgi:hypothetical protein
LRFGLRLSIPGDSVEYFAVPHCSFSSTGSRPGWGDFNQQWVLIFSSVSWGFVVLMLQGMLRHDLPMIREASEGCSWLWYFCRFA